MEREFVIGFNFRGFCFLFFVGDGWMDGLGNQECCLSTAACLSGFFPGPEECRFVSFPFVSYADLKSDS